MNVRVFSSDEDDKILAWTRGERTLMSVEQEIGAAVETIKKRATELGILVDEPELDNEEEMKRLWDQFRIGDIDPLLVRLNTMHPFRRYESLDLKTRKKHVISN